MAQGPYLGNQVNGPAAGNQDAGGIAGVFGQKTAAAKGPNAQAYTQQMNANQKQADDQHWLSQNYTQNAASPYAGQSRADIGGNVGAQRNLASTLMNNNGEASKAQFQSGLDQGIAAQTAMANSAPGGATQRAGALRNAQQTGATMQAQGAATAAELGAREREASLAQAGNVYGQVGNELQGQYGLETNAALTNQGQQNNMRLGYGQLGNQSQGQSEQALNDYTTQDQNAQKLSYGIKQGNAQDTDNAIGTVAGLAGDVLGGIGSFLAHGGPMHAGGAPAIASVYGGAPPAPAPKPVTLADALDGIEHLKAKIAELEARHHGR